MLLQLESTKKNIIQKLLAFAAENNIQLSLVDADKTKLYLPGKSLTAKETKQLIEDSRKSGIVSMAKTHKLIKQKLNGN